MPVADESYCHRRHHSLSWDLEQCEVPLHYVKLSMLWDECPPENALQSLQGRVLSEHELRVQRSLQQLNVPDWYKNSSRPAEGFLLKRGSDASSSVAGRRGAGGWPGLGVKTTSLSSLRSPTTAVRLGSSPSPPPAAFTRWSSSRLHSAGSASATPSTSPSGSARSSFNHRQPYLGWRSQERLSGTPRTPAERLAQGLLEQREHQRQQERLRGSSQLQTSSTNLSDVRTSIKEVTSAIVHYVSAANGPGSTTDVRLAGSTPSTTAPAASRDREDHPRSHGSHGGSQRVCWIESSFVGSRPIEQPQTPDEGSVSTSPLPAHHQDLYLDLKQRASTCATATGAMGAAGALPSNGPTSVPGAHQSHGVAAAVESPAASPVPFGALVSRPSPSSTTMEDVLDSLLGLPPPSRSPSPGPAATASGSGSAGQQVSLAPAAQHQARSTCADIRPDPAGSASGGAVPVPPGPSAGRWRSVDGQLEEADDGPEPAGWEAADLAGVEPAAGASSRTSREKVADLPGWNDEDHAPPPAAPPGWQGSAVVGVVAEEGDDDDARAEAEFGAALLSLPLDAPTTATRSASTPRRRRSESSALDQVDLGEGRRHSLGQGAANGQGRLKAPRKPPRRVSFDLTATGAGAGGALDGEAVACRRYGCSRVAPEASARLRFKTCHNCSHTYCSRECRREHWDSHKRACAVQRVGGLLRRVVARVRGDTAALSSAARRGYKAHGRGVVRLLFHSTDAAEAYCAGEVAVGTGPGQELVFVRWAELPAGELGGSLHEDLTRLCNTYNPRTRAVTLVVLEVLSEAPSDDGVVMWERQLVSRVFKVHLFREDQLDSTLVLVGALAAHVRERSAVLRNIIRAVGQRGVDLRDEEHADAFICVKEFVDGRGLVPITVDMELQGGGRLLVVLVPNVPADSGVMGATADGADTIDVSARASDTED